MAFYVGLQNTGEESIANIQRQLKEYYALLLGLLAASVTVIAPALTASAIASERQRRSLDLILSTPLHIKSYLVGKLIASYRYTWMLLILSLPILSMCVILGGATWMEVVIAYFRLSLFGLLFTAIGLLMSVLAPKPVSAIAFSYIAVGFYVFLSTAVAGLASGGSTGTNLFGLAFLNPFVDAIFVLNRVTVDYAMLLWIPLVVFVAVACKILLLAAASALGGYASPFTKNLRLHILLALTIVFGLLASQLPSSMVVTYSAAVASPSASPAIPTHYDVLIASTAGGLLCYAAIFLHWIIPFAACYSPYAERRFHDDGLFNLRTSCTGTPSGALPYILLLALAGATAVLIVFWFMSVPVHHLHYMSGAAWAVAFLVLVWAVCRFISSISRNLTTARGGTFVFLVCFLLLPTPVLQALAEIDGNSDVWRYHPFYSGLVDSSDRYSMAGYMFVAALIFLFLSITHKRKRLVDSQESPR